MDSYKTIAGIAEGYITEQRSKFIAFAVPVQTPEQVKEMVDNYRKKYYDARHVCWAYLLGVERTQFRVNDDGEPSSTAGKPILGVINSHELTDILIVVIRYFGGVKLGTSGLITAYRAAALDAVQNARIIDKTVDEDITILFEYPFLNSVMRIVKEENVQVISQTINVSYLDEYIVRMRMGGLSTSISKQMKKWQEDMKLYRAHGFNPYVALAGKILSKIPQYYRLRILRFAFCEIIYIFVHS